MTLKASREKGSKVKFFDSDNIPSSLPNNWIGFNTDNNEMKCSDSDGDVRGTSALVDPSKFGNWILLFEKEYSADTVSESITNVLGNSTHEKIKVVTHTDINGSLILRFNNDSASNYFIGQISQDGSTVSGWSGSSTSIGISSNTQGYFEMTGSLKSGSRRTFNRINSRYISTNSDSHLQILSYLWNNTANEITSIQLSSSLSYTGKVSIYYWQDIKPVELHSYELVKEINLSSETLSESITWDGNTDEHCKIIMDLTAGAVSTSDVRIRFNNDTTSNYRYSYLTQNGSTASAGYDNSNDYMMGSVGYKSGEVFSQIDLSLKSGKKRFITTETVRYDSDAADHHQYTISGSWNNTTSNVTSINLYTLSNISGTIKVYRIAKSHLICTQPGLNSLWLKSVDSNTIEIQPGDIEINGVVHNISTSKQITLSGNLRSGESESSSTYYYLYVIQDDSRIPTYKFSSIKPTLDRFGNTVSFEDNTENPLYHPNEGITWRYIGQVYNNSSSNILSFAKCKPGYWESTWNSIPGTGVRTIYHGSAIIPKFIEYNVSTTSNGVSYQIPPHAQYYDGSSWKGILLNHVNVSTTSTISTLFSTSGIWHDGSWHTTGYYKLIITN